ncbi:hypothetical protein [Undibacterium sp. TJN19]|uniref:hypothetical protein n=1 Tax=Undibacterium sp. TJN19 TaxID=3413055 RepID=UPI003BF38A3C
MSSNTDNKFISLCRAAFKRQGKGIIAAAVIVGGAAFYRSKQFEMDVLLKLLLVAAGFFLVAVGIEWIRDKSTTPKADLEK